jgi:hypothetical protein
MNVLRHWTLEDREHLAVVALDAIEHDRGELVRRITTSYVPARHYQGAVDALAELVRLKDGPRDNAYRAAKDAAWDAAWDEARAVLARLGGR